MTPFAHMFWSAAWAGLAASAVQRARNFVRVAARASGGKMPPAAAHLTRARVGLETLRGVVQSAIRTFERRACEANGLDGFDMQTSVNLLKVEASELAVSVVMSAMRACGLSGYRNDTEFTLGRHLRDVLSSPIMINNDRILANAEATVLMSEVPTALNF
jgi:acyl-CoA dehydrogenase